MGIKVNYIGLILKATSCNCSVMIFVVFLNGFTNNALNVDIFNLMSIKNKKDVEGMVRVYKVKI